MKLIQPIAKKLSPETLKVLVTLAIGVRRARKRYQRAKRIVEADKSGRTDSFERYDLDRSEAQRDALEYSLYLTKASVGRYKKQFRFEPIPDYGDHMTLQDWISACDCGGFIDYDGHGDLATADQCSNFQISPSERHLVKIPEWATHVVWYNK